MNDYQCYLHYQTSTSVHIILPLPRGLNNRTPALRSSISLHASSRSQLSHHTIKPTSSINGATQARRHTFQSFARRAVEEARTFRSGRTTFRPGCLVLHLEVPAKTSAKVACGGACSSIVSASALHGRSLLCCVVRICLLEKGFVSSIRLRKGLGGLSELVCLLRRLSLFVFV